MSDIDARLPGYIPSSAKQALSSIWVYPTITLGQKIENRPPDVQRKSEKIPKSTKKAPNQGKGGKMKVPVNGGKSKKLPELTLKQSLFIQYYTDPNSDTYGNKTRSYMKAYGTESYNGAATEAVRTLQKPKIHAWIDDILEKQGVDTKARVGALASIAHNNTTPRCIKRTITTKRGTTVIEERQEPTHSERLKAIDQLNKLSGDYDRARNKATLETQDMIDLRRRTFTQDKAKLDRIDRAKDVTPGNPQGKTGGRG